MHKICGTCNQEKSITEFSICSQKADGYQHACKSCVKQKNKEYYLSNKITILEKNKERYIINKDFILEQTRIYKDKNKCVILEKQKEYYSQNKEYYRDYNKQYEQVNKSKRVAIGSKRRAAKLQALPKWLTEAEHEEIKELYEIARMFKLYTGEEYHVDHIVPLQGENVCGLHVPWNLQVIPAKENLSKSNKLQEEIL